MIRSVWFSAAFTLLTLACGPPGPQPVAEPPPDPSMSEAELAARFDAELQPLFDRSIESLEEAPERVRFDVLRTCDWWRHRDMPCDPWLVRRHQLECWLEGTEAEMRHAYSLKLRQRTTQRKILRRQTVCMGDRGWMRIKQEAKR
jgi:hypothetical protein